MVQYKRKKYFIKTFGCQANIADSNNIAGVLESLGFQEAESIEDSDVFIINTCSVRQKSEDKVYGIAKKFEGGRKPFVVLAGCMVGSALGDRKRFSFRELKDRTPWVDEYIGPAQALEIPKILIKNNLIDDWAIKKLNPLSIKAKLSDLKHAFVNISSGCDNFCTFCVVPYARGKEVSRSESEILDEINRFVDGGVSEITLCGQNVNSWGLSVMEKFEVRAGSDYRLPFADLLGKIHKIEKVEKISFISSNPFDFSNDLINVLKLPKISNYLHIAVQSGNNDILKKMHRRHTVEDFTDLLEKIRKARPDAEFGTDIIVGFSGETEEQFMDTVALFKKISFKVAYISMYSSRKGTVAERLYKDDVPLKEKKRRHKYLTGVWKENRDER